MSRVGPLFSKRFLVLIGLFLGILVLSRLALNEGEETKELSLYIAITKNLPEIPDLEDWPGDYFDSLKSAYSGVADFEGVFLNSYEEIGYLYLQNGFLREANVVFGVLIDWDPVNELWLYCYIKSFGESLANDGRLAMESFSFVANDYSRVHASLVEVYCLEGKTDEALGLARDSVRRWPNGPQANYDLANVLLFLGRYEEANLILSNLEFLGRNLEDYDEALFDVFGAFESDSKTLGSSSDQPRITELSSLYFGDAYERRLDVFRFSFAGLAELLEINMELGNLNEVDLISEKMELWYSK